MSFFYGGAMAVSPDGRWLVFPATGDDGVSRYWLRSLDTVEARALPGTEGAYVPVAWTADSRHVIFSLLGVGGQLGGQILKADIQGGPPQALGPMPPGAINGATSNRDVILFGSSAVGQPLFRIPIAGGAASPVTVLRDGETGHKFPQFLPGGRRFLYFRVSNDPEKAGIYVGSIDVAPDAQSLDRVLATSRQAYYAPPVGAGSGHLVFMRDTTLMAQPFDPDALHLSGNAVPVAQGIDSFAPVSYALFGVSDSGTLVYRTGVSTGFSIVSFDEARRQQGAFGEPGVYSTPAVSPDGTRVAVARGSVGDRDIWIIDTTRNTTQRFTFDGADDFSPVWSPDGTSIAFASTRSGQARVYVKPADGLGEEQVLTDQPGTPTSWSPDGRSLLFSGVGRNGSADIWVLSNPGRPDATPRPVLATDFIEQAGQFSPDGRWIVYTSNESGATEVYVRPFVPDGAAGAGGVKYLVSRGLANFPRWRGTTIFYTSSLTFDLLAVDVDTSQGFRAGIPQRLFTAPPPLLPSGWELSPGGDRFYFMSTPDGGKAAPFTVVVNWAASLAP
jgi:eukaryotic-like serine/threonine-protein kinase